MHKILIIDDHALVAHGMKSIFAVQAGMEVVQCVQDARQALAAIAKHKPNVVLLDLAMPTLHGTDLIDPIKATDPSIRIIVLTGLSDPALLAEVFEKSPHAIMQKMGDPGELLDAVRAPESSQTMLCKACQKMFDQLDSELETILPLTQREREIVSLLSKGETTKGAALVLGISEHTVRKHRENTLAKFGARSTGQLVALAARRGYID